MAKNRDAIAMREKEEREEREDREGEVEEDDSHPRSKHKPRNDRKSKRSVEESDDSESSEESEEERRHRSKRKRRSSKRRYSSESESESDSDSEDESESESESGSGLEESEEERRRRRRKREKRRREEKERRREKEKKRRRREKEEDEKRKRKKKKERREKEDKKRRSKERAKGKIGAVTNSWGKFGIIRETDMWNKRPEFTAWLHEVKKVNLESLPNWEEKKMFKEYMEDYNTATFSSKKYYDLDAYHRHKMEKEIQKGMGKIVQKERTEFNDEDQRRQELMQAREKEKEKEAEALKNSMQSGMAQAMIEQARLREEMVYLFKIGNTEAATAIQRKLDPDVAM